MTKKQLEDALDTAMTPYLKAFLMYPAVARFKTKVEAGTASADFFMHAEDHTRLDGTNLEEVFDNAFNALSKDLDGAKGATGISLRKV
jgi:hypothetical protein